MRIFFVFAEASFRVQASFSRQVFVLIIGALINVVARVAIWTSVYDEQSSVSGVELNQMVTYSIIGTCLLLTWDSGLTIRDLGAEIRSGHIANKLLLPYQFPLFSLALQFGARVHYVLTTGLPVIILVSLFTGLLPPASMFALGLFIISCAISFAILFSLSTIFALICFWLFNAISAELMLRGILVLLSGELVPLWFFPEGLARVVENLPFCWITFYPMAIYLGEIDHGAAVLTVAGGLIWVSVLLSILFLLWRRICQTIALQGG
ncbi:MAG: ABC-2 family transporter protein [Pseudomonadota bacterium]